MKNDQPWHLRLLHVCSLRTVQVTCVPPPLRDSKQSVAPIRLAR